jgi:GNAT superfamily N-acetyltransferase
VRFVIKLAELEDWEAVRDIRLRSLREEPDAYASEYQTEARFEPDLWQQRPTTASSYLAIDDDDQALVGIATGLKMGDGDTYVVGMYVAPEAPGSRCAHQLLDAIADLATRRHGKRFGARGARVQYPRHAVLQLVRIRGDRSATHFGPRPEHHRD